MNPEYSKKLAIRDNRKAKHFILRLAQFQLKYDSNTLNAANNQLNRNKVNKNKRIFAEKVSEIMESKGYSEMDAIKILQEEQEQLRISMLNAF